MTDKYSRSARQRLFLILMLGSLSTVSPFSIDMYLPAFPDIAREMKTSLANVSFSLSTYFFGFAIGQIFYGPLLDRFGRKRPLYFGLTLYILASVGCLLSTKIEVLLVMRFFQAFGSCVASVGAITMVQDFFPLRESVKIRSFLILILGVSPMLAPSLGSFVVTTWNWHAVFAFLSGIGVVILSVVIFFLPEGHQPDPTVSLRAKPILRTFRSIIIHPTFSVYAIAGSFAFSGLFVYLAGSPSIFMNGFKVTATGYAAIFAFLSIGIIGGSQLNLFLVKRFTSETIFRFALYMQVISAILFLTGTYLDVLGLPGTLFVLFFFLLSIGLAYPNAAALALAPFSKNAGSASALLGFLQIGIGAVISAGVGFVNLNGFLSTPLVMLFSSSTALVLLLARKSRISNVSILDKAAAQETLELTECEEIR